MYTMLRSRIAAVLTNVIALGISAVAAVSVAYAQRGVCTQVPKTTKCPGGRSMGKCTTLKKDGKITGCKGIPPFWRPFVGNFFCSDGPQQFTCHQGTVEQAAPCWASYKKCHTTEMMKKCAPDSMVTQRSYVIKVTGLCKP